MKEKLRVSVGFETTYPAYSESGVNIRYTFGATTLVTQQLAVMSRSNADKRKGYFSFDTHVCFA